MSRQRKEANPGESLFGTHVASIDVGSHTTRMIIARIDWDGIVPVRIERRVTRLAQGFQQSGELAPEAVERTVSALGEYRGLIERYKADRIACGATGVVRLASNSARLFEDVAAATGIRVALLSEEREAFLSAKGVLSLLPRVDSDFLSFDIGGGSTEFLLVVSGEKKPAWSTSLPVGAAVLTEAFLAGDPPGADAVREAAQRVGEKLVPVKEQVLAALCARCPFPSPPLLAGTAGTISTLAAMYLGMTDYVPYRINGLCLGKDWLSQVVADLAEKPVAARRGIPGLEPGREDIILGGAVIVREILACFDRSWVVVTDAGLLEGLLLELVEKESGLPETLTTPLTWQLQKG